MTTTELLRAHVEMLADTIGERHVWRRQALNEAALYITSTLESLRYAVRLQKYMADGCPVQNIEGTLIGSREAESHVIIGAHYDTVPGCPGANDNGSGVAALLDLARRFAQQPRSRTVRFVAFVNEEPPFFQTPLMGSAVYAHAARLQRDRIVAMLSLETIGYYSDAPDSQQYPAPLGRFFPSTGNFLGFVSNLRSARLLRRAQRAFKAHTSFPIQAAPAPESIPGVAWSDQWAFWREGFPAIMVTDTAPYRYPWYHTADDTPDKIVYDKFAQAVDGLEHVIRVLSEK